MSKKICYEATIRIEFVPDELVEDDDTMWEEAGAMSDAICLLVENEENSVKSVEICDYAECYIDED